MAHSIPKQSRTPAASNNTNDRTEKKKAPTHENKSANNHFKNIIKESDSNLKKK
jgi:hypothetical protein